jgi:hypothetical protein
MSVTLVIASLVIPVAVLLVDYGRRRLTTWRILRPFLAIAIIPFVAPGLDLGGRGLLLEVAGVVAGALLGLLAGAAMRVERDPQTSVPMTVAGVAYAAIWLVIAFARLAFAYEAQHSPSFARALGGFLASSHISSTALADSILFLSIAILIALRGSLAVRAYRPGRVATPAREIRTTGARV